MTPIQGELRGALHSDSERGWNSLFDAGIAGLFQRYGQRKSWNDWPLTADGFFDFCTSICFDGDELLVCLHAVVGDAAVAARHDGKGLSEKCRVVLLAVCTLGIERWVTSVSAQFKVTAPDTSKPFRLEVDDPWVVYLIAACALELQLRIQADRLDVLPNFVHVPTQMVTVIAPNEAVLGVNQQAQFDMVETALVQVLRQRDAAMPSKGHIQRLLRAASSSENRSGLLLGVRFDDEGNVLQSAAVRDHAEKTWRLKTVMYGTTTPDAALKAFEEGLSEMVRDLQLALSPHTTQGENMSHSKNPLTQNFYGSVGNVGDYGNAALATGERAQASVGGINNHGIAPGDLASLLDAFAAQMRANPALKGSVDIIDAHVTEIKALAENPDNSEGSGKKVKAFVEAIGLMTSGLEKSSALVVQGRAIVEKCIEQWPIVVTLGFEVGKFFGSM
jgi:hypothetical protein